MKYNKKVTGIFVLVLLLLIAGIAWFLLLQDRAIEKTCLLQFDTQGGTELIEQEYACGAKSKQPGKTMKEGYTFAGWTTQDQETYAFDTALTKDTTLIATWKKSKMIDHLTIQTEANKKVYYVGDDVHVEGLIILVTYDDQTSEAIEKGFQAEVDTSTTGIKEVMITYQKHQLSYQVEVKEQVLVDIAMKSSVKDVYTTSDRKLDTKDLGIFLIYENGTKKELNKDFQIDSSQVAFGYVGTYNVYIYYQGFYTMYQIQIKEAILQRMEVKEMPKKRSYMEGEIFDPTGLVVEGSFSDGTKKAIECTYDLHEKLSPEDTAIVLSYDNLTTKVEISVKAIAKPKIALDTHVTGKMQYVTSAFINVSVSSEATLTSVEYGVYVHDVFISYESIPVNGKEVKFKVELQDAADAQRLYVKAENIAGTSELLDKNTYLVDHATPSIALRSEEQVFISDDTAWNPSDYVITTWGISGVGTIESTALISGEQEVVITAKANNGLSASVRIPVKLDNLYQKRVLFTGDSTAYGYATNGRGYGYYLNLKHAFSLLSSVAANDATINTYTQGMNNTIAQIEATRYNSYDYVILSGGFGDLRDIPAMGSLSDSLDPATFADSSTFAGALDLYFYQTTSIWDKAKIGFIISYDVPRNHSGIRDDHTKAKEYWDMAKQACEKWNIPYLNLFDGGKVVDHAYQTYSDLLDVTGSTYLLQDYIHPNETGYAYITSILDEWMQTLPAYHAPDTSVTIAKALDEKDSSHPQRSIDIVATTQKIISAQYCVLINGKRTLDVGLDIRSEHAVNLTHTFDVNQYPQQLFITYQTADGITHTYTDQAVFYLASESR